MMVRSSRMFLRALGLTSAIFMAAVAVPFGQAAAPAAPAGAPQAGAAAVRPMSEDVFKNIQVFKGVPADELLASMGFISNALAVNCTYCHLGEGGGGWAEYARDNDKKIMARKMVTMMTAINQTYFGGRRVVTCVSCHNNSNRPKVTTNMAAYYSAPLTDEPDTILQAAPNAPTVDQVLAKYITAIGGADKVARLTSFVAKGTYLGYGEAEPAPFEIFAKAPNQYSSINHTFSGDITTTYDGTNGWLAQPEEFTPLPMRTLTGGDLGGAKLEAALAFPTTLKQGLTNWRGAIPGSMGDHDIQVIQATMAGGFPVKLYFDDESGLLLRVLRYTETPVGRDAWLIDYEDYRDVGGVKMPFKQTLRLPSAQAVIELKDVQPNVAIPAARFAKPTPPAPVRAKR